MSFQTISSINYGLLNHVLTDIHEFASNPNMKLNPGKCKEMFINFMHDHNIFVNPIMMGNKEIECVSNYKLLGVCLNEDQKGAKVLLTT